jgi:flagellar hook protein FlgE
MGITSALYSGVSGLNTNSSAMSVVGNNLANTNTLGFKGSRTVFSDMLSSTVFGSGGKSQVGRGVTLSKVDNIFSQGTFESTSSDTDVAIEGEGFFMLKEVGNDTTLYSRAGAFRFNSEGYLINPEGYRVQGKGFDANGNLIAGDATDIQVQNVGLVPAKVTDTITLNTNLDSASIIIDPVATPFSYDDPTTFNYSSSTPVYDTLGEAHLVTVYFRKQDPAALVPPNDNAWDYWYSSTDSTGAPFGDIANGAAARGTITFDQTGNLDPPLPDPVPPLGANPNGTGEIPALDFLNGSVPTATRLVFDTTQFNSESTVISENQNGYAAGNLTNVGINADGVVIASYNNGEQVKISSLVLAKFNNPGGLELVGSNMFTATEASGAARSGLPGPELGKIFTNSLEQSNVDMGQEFVKMITVQRGFQANSKIITTVDDMLGELINLKR